MNRVSHTPILARILPLVLMAAALAGCSSVEGEFPSLERRPFEQAAPVVAPTLPPTPVASSLPAAMDASVRALQARHDKASAAFDAMLPAVRVTANAASSSPTGSEAWVGAQLMVSRLDKARSDAVAAVAEMDGLLLVQQETESQGATILLSPLLKPALDKMVQRTARQNQEIDRLSRMIGQ